MDQSILREYLVALGFKIDPVGQKKFDDGVGGIDKRVSALGKTMLSVAAGASAMVLQFAFSMEKLYYSSKRAESSAGSLQALAFGAGQVGLSAEHIKASIEGMARAMRSNPGLEGLLNSLGVPVTGRDKADVLMDMVEQLKKMPQYLAQQYAGLFGIDPDSLFMLTEGLDAMRKAIDLRKEMAKDAGLDMDKAALAGRDYANAIKEITTRLGVLKDVIAISMLPAFMSFTTAINNNLAALTNWLGKFESVGAAVTSLFDAEKSKRKGNAKSLFEWITTHRDDRDAPGPADKEPANKTNKEPATNKQSRIPGMNYIGDPADTPPPALMPPVDGPKKTTPAGWARSLIPDSWRKKARGIRNNNPGNLEFRNQPGALRENGGEGRFAQFQTPEAGLLALSKQLQIYSARGIKSVADIIKTYAPDSENNTPAYVKVVAAGMGVEPRQPLDNRDPTMMANLIKAIVRHENGVNPYTPAQIQEAAVKGVSFNQDTKIIVYGTGDAKDTANEIAARQQEINAATIRQLTPRIN